MNLSMPRRSELDGHEPEIVSRYQAGESAASIGASFGVWHNAVRRVLREAGIEIRPKGPYRRPLQGREQDIATMYRAGFSLKELAELVGCSRVCVKHALAIAGEPLRPRGSHASRAGIELRQDFLRMLSTANEPTLEAMAERFRAVRQEGGKPRRR